MQSLVEDLRRTLQVGRAELFAKLVGPCALRVLDGPERGEAGRRDHQQVGPAVPGVGAVLGVTVVDKHVGQALDALTGLAHLAGDIGDRGGTVLDRFEHEPAGEGLPADLGESLTSRAEPVVEREHAHQERGKRLAGRCPHRRTIDNLLSFRYHIVIIADREKQEDKQWPIL